MNEYFTSLMSYIFTAVSQQKVYIFFDLNVDQSFNISESHGEK